MLRQPAAKEARVVPALWKGLAPRHAIPGEGSFSRPSEGPDSFSRGLEKGNACLSHLLLFHNHHIGLGPCCLTLRLLTSGTGKAGLLTHPACTSPDSC